MEFQVLGPMRIGHDGQETGPTGRLQRVLLGMLLLNANRPVSSDTLVDAMWGERPGLRNRPNLHVHIHRLRGTLGEPQRLTSAADGYLLKVLPGELDAERFETLVTDAAEYGSTDPQRTTGLLRKAIQLWQGVPFEGLDTPALADEARRLDDRRLTAIEALFAAELACGRHAEVIAELSEQVRLHPLRERLQATLLVALFRAGQQARALAVYQSARQLLVDELGQEPGPELRHIHERVLAGDAVNLGLPQAHPVPAQLPHDVPDFVGRDPELAELDRLSRTLATPVVVVSGTAGVGKTALVKHWAHEARKRFPDGQLYTDLRGYAPDNPMRTGEVLAGFLRALGVDDTAIPADLAQRAARFRTVVDQKQLLIVLDNALTAHQVRPLLPGSMSCFVLVTSRDSLAGLIARDGAHRLALDRMSHDEARALISNRLGHVFDRDFGHDLGHDETVPKLIEYCARLPLAMRVATGRIQDRRDRDLAALVDELADERSQLDIFETGDEHTSVRAVFSWSYHQLPDDAARMFRLFGLTCAHREHLLSLAGATALLGTGDLRSTRRLLDVLVRANLIVSFPNGRYALHDLLRVYAAELAEEHEDVAAAQERLLGYFLHAATGAAARLGRTGSRPDPGVPTPPVILELPDAEAARGWLETERPSLLCAAEWAARSGRRSCVLALLEILRGHPGGVGSSLDFTARLRDLEGSIT